MESPREADLDLDLDIDVRLYRAPHGNKFVRELLIRAGVEAGRRRMKLGVALSNDESDISPGLIVEQVLHAEKLGYDSVWLPDHLLPPEPYGDVYGGVYEPLTLLAHLAAVTSRIVLGTSVIIAPLREPVLLAKQLGTIERLAPGRLVFGLGVGWEADEFNALGVPFSERGARTDEMVRLISALHSGKAPTAGRFFPPATGVFEPRPSAPIPIMVGGVTPPALRRAAQYAERWQAFGLDPEQFRLRRAELDRLATPRRVSAGTMFSRRESSKSTEELVESLHRWQTAGADEVTVHFGLSEHTRAPMAELIDRWHASQ